MSTFRAVSEDDDEEEEVLVSFEASGMSGVSWTAEEDPLRVEELTGGLGGGEVLPFPLLVFAGGCHVCCWALPLGTVEVAELPLVFELDEVVFEEAVVSTKGSTKSGGRQSSWPEEPPAAPDFPPLLLLAS